MVVRFDEKHLDRAPFVRTLYIWQGWVEWIGFLPMRFLRCGWKHNLILKGMSMKTLAVRDRLLWISLAIQRDLVWVVLGIVVAYAIYVSCIQTPVPGLDEEALKKVMAH